MESPRGLIAFLGLSHWWLTALSEDERSIIRSRFSPLGGGDDRMDEGDISFTSLDTCVFLRTVAGWCPKPIAAKFIAEASRREMVKWEFTALGDPGHLQTTKIEAPEMIAAPRMIRQESPEHYYKQLIKWLGAELARGVGYSTLDEAMGHKWNEGVDFGSWSLTEMQTSSQARTVLWQWLSRRMELAQNLASAGDPEGATRIRLHLYYHDEWPGYTLFSRLRVDLTKIKRYDEAIKLIETSLARRSRQPVPSERRNTEDRKSLERLKKLRANAK